MNHLEIIADGMSRGRGVLRRAIDGLDDFALAFGEEHGVSIEQGVERLRTFGGVPGRLDVIRAGELIVGDDTYNANPASMRAALAWLARRRVRR